jgi:4-carboxymuconolactone decarboxylase
MARVSTIEEGGKPELAALIAKIKGARRGKLINVYKLLLHAPELAATWFDHNNAVRWKTGIDGRLREIVVIRIGILLGAAYILRQHVPALAIAEGVTQAECDALRDWRASSLFSDRESAVLAYADAMTRDIKVPDAIYAELKPHFSEREIVELTVLVGTYNMHARVIQALEIDLETN